MSDDTPWDDVISRETLLALYDDAMERGGTHSPPKAGCVEQCLGSAWTAEGYRQDEGIFVGILFAGYLAFYLAKDHCFTDGNKRIAWSALTHVLRYHGVAIDSSDDEAVSVMNGVASGAVDIDQLLDWLVQHVSEAPDLNLQ